MPRPTAIDASNRFRAQLLANEAAAAERMGRTYARIYISLQDQLNQLADQIAVMETPSNGQIIRLARTQQLLNQVEEQAARFGVIVQNEVDVIRSQAIEQGVKDGLALIEESLPPLSEPLRRQLVASFTTLPVEAIETMTGLLTDDSELTARLQQAYGRFVASQVSDHLLDGLAKGQNPRTIARLIDRNVKNSLGVGLKSSLTTVRTAQIKSYQLAVHSTYAANERIVPTWIWHSALDDRTCMSCVVNHGLEFPITERLNDHHNGRCAPIPKTITYRDLGINLDEPLKPVQTGQDWFNSQPAAVQKDMMKPAKYEAWKSGLFDLRDLSKPYSDDVYGELVREATLRELLGERP